MYHYAIDQIVILFHEKIHDKAKSRIIPAPSTKIQNSLDPHTILHAFPYDCYLMPPQKQEIVTSFPIITLSPNKKQPRDYTHLGLFFTDLIKFHQKRQRGPPSAFHDLFKHISEEVLQGSRADKSFYQSGIISLRALFSYQRSYQAQGLYFP